MGQHEMDGAVEYPLLDGITRHERDGYELTHNPPVVGSIPTRPTGCLPDRCRRIQLFDAPGRPVEDLTSQEASKS